MEKRLKEIIQIIESEKISDVHFELNKAIKIQGRVGKKLITIPAKKDDDRLINYLLLLSNLDLSNNNVPQSGAFEYKYNHKIYNFRFAYLKSNNTISAVLRVLNYHIPLSLDKVFLKGDCRRQIKDILTKESGLILISGPTGSGKTTTAYAILNYLNNRKIYTIEDPIEIYLENINQIQLNRTLGLDYDEILKQILRHDPDVIFIGEIRDSETAKIAFRCALTGHIVISTIHSNDCPHTISRLIDLNVSKLDIDDSLICILNQRLFNLKNYEKRFSLYEIFNEKDIKEYLQNKQRSYPKLSTEIIYAKQKGWL